MAGKQRSNVRRPGELTLEVLERQLFQSTPLGGDRTKRGYALELDLSSVTFADLAGTAALVAAIEGALRRHIEVTLTLPSPNATESEMVELRRGITPKTPEGSRATILAVRDRVRGRARVARYLESIGFFDAIRYLHLPDEVGSLLTVSETPGANVELTTSGGLPGGSGTELRARVPLQWLVLQSKEQAEQARQLLDSQLDAIGAPFSLRFVAHELIDNAHNHSVWEHENLPLGFEFAWRNRACLFAMTIEWSATNGEAYHLVAMDGGVGIPYTLRPGPSSGKKRSDAEVLVAAFDDSTSRKRDSRPAPRGLGTVRRLVQRDGGVLLAASGRGRTVISDSDRLPSQGGGVHGTAMYVTLPTARRASDGPAEPPGALRLSVTFRAFDASGRLVFLHDPPAGDGAKPVEVLVLEEQIAEAALEALLQYASTTSHPVVLVPTRGDSAVSSLVFARLQTASVRAPVIALSASTIEATADPGLGDSWREWIRGALYRSSRDALNRSIERLIIERLPTRPSVTWSLGTVAKWLDPNEIVSLPLAPLLPFVVGTAIAHELPDPESSTELVVTDRALDEVTRTAASWVPGTTRVAVLQNPHEPDVARFVGQPPAVTVVVSAVVNQGGAIGPVLRALRKSRRREVKILTIVDGSGHSQAGKVDPYGRPVAFDALTTYNFDADEADAQRLEEACFASMLDAFDRAHDSPLLSTASATQGALHLGHFHTRRRRYLSVLVDPARVSEPGSALADFCLSELLRHVDEVAARVDARSVEVVGAGAGGRWATQLASRLQVKVPARSGSGPALRVIVDWGAVSGSSLHDEAYRAIEGGAEAVLLAVAVDRSEGTLLGRFGEFTVHRSVDAPVPTLFDEPAVLERTCHVFSRAAGRLPVDPQTYVDCPLCKVERSTIEAWRETGISGVLPPLSHLEPRTVNELPIQGATDGVFDSSLTGARLHRMLAWRSVVFEGLDDREIAFGLLRMLELREWLDIDALAIAQVFCYDAHLLDARPWTNQRFRTALARMAASELNDHLDEYDSGALSALVTVSRLADKKVFIDGVDATFALMPQNLQLTALGSLATLITRDYHRGDSIGESARKLVVALHDGNHAGVVGAVVARLQSYVATREMDAHQGPMIRWERFRSHAVEAYKHVSPSAERERLLGFIALAEKGLVTDELRALATDDWRSLRDVWLQGVFPHLGGLDPALSWLRSRYDLSWLASHDDPTTLNLALLDTLDSLFELGQEVDLDRARSSLETLTSGRVGSLAEFATSCPCDLIVELERLVGSMSDFPVALKPFPLDKIQIFLPQRVLRNVLHHLLENGEKHNSSSLSIEVQLVSAVKVRVRSVYRGKDSGGDGLQAEPNRYGGLSDSQYGGDLRAFGGSISFPTSPAPSQFTVHIDLIRWNG